MQSKNIFSTWLPCIQHWFSSLNSMQPFGQGWAFLPFNKPLAYFRAKMPTPALMAAYCFMRKTSSSCRATNYIQFFSLLQSFFSVYIHHISVILLNKRTFLSRMKYTDILAVFLQSLLPKVLRRINFFLFNLPGIVLSSCSCSQEHHATVSIKVGPHETFW